MSDAQPTARLVLVSPPGLTDVPALATHLVGRGIEAVYIGERVTDNGAAEALADLLGVPCRSAEGDLGDEGGGLHGVAREHLGETVVVVRPGPERHTHEVLSDGERWWVADELD